MVDKKLEMKRKLEILVNCDFSDWRKRERTGDWRNQSRSIFGFSSGLVGLSGAVSNIVDRVGEPLPLIKDCYMDYGILISDYATIPFHEMNPKDKDFKFLFDYKKKLDELGGKLKLFIDKCHQTKFNCSREWKEFKELKETIDDLSSHNYRRDVLAKYNIDLSDPVS